MLLICTPPYYRTFYFCRDPNVSDLYQAAIRLEQRQVKRQLCSLLSAYNGRSGTAVRRFGMVHRGKLGGL